MPPRRAATPCRGRADGATHALDSDNNRQIKPGSAIYLLEQITCPGILVECGFLSNANEAALLQQGTYQTKLACAITGAVLHYLESEAEHLEV